MKYILSNHFRLDCPSTSLNRLVINRMWGALRCLSGFIHACPNNSLIEWRRNFIKTLVNGRLNYKINKTYSLLIDAKIAWSRTVICSAISRADNVSMFSRLGIYRKIKMMFQNRKLKIGFQVKLITTGCASKRLRSILVWDGSSLVSNCKSWEAALCSAGNSCGEERTSSKNSMVKFFNLKSTEVDDSKSSRCLDIQWRKTLSTRIVAADDMMLSFRSRPIIPPPGPPPGPPLLSPPDGWGWTGPPKLPRGSLVGKLILQ